MKDSVFTRIIKGEIPCHKVYEDDRVIAFLDIHPKQPGHILLVPKQQVDLIWDLDAETYGYLWKAAAKIAKHISPILGKRIGVQVEGIGVPHAHVHLVPFTTTTEFLAAQETSAEPDHDALAAMASRLSL